MLFYKQPVGIRRAVNCTTLELKRAIQEHERNEFHPVNYTIPELKGVNFSDQLRLIDTINCVRMVTEPGLL
ncbi:MAG: hypothetical protein PHH93_10390 [Prolixibacteraceae bacterium]|nr:hypothetical protein [Prolixibacteraceae bacterium]